jgi:hypothetical protein
VILQDHKKKAENRLSSEIKKNNEEKEGSSEIRKKEAKH